jgi:hypothetical protein
MSEVLDVGGRRQLFLDGRLIARSENVRVVMNPARATGEVLLAHDQPHEQQAAHARIGSYSSVRREGGKFRLWWFHSVDRRDGDLRQRRVCYAESDDGLHFRKPALGLMEMGGTTAASSAVIADPVQGCCVWIDPKAPPQHRYRTQAKFGPYPGTPTTLWFYGSPDGIRWEKTHEVKMTDCDTQNVILFDESYGRYVMYTRLWRRSDNPNRNHRMVRRLESDDLMTWENEQVIFEADEIDMARHQTSTGQPPVDYYGACVFKYPQAGDLYICLAQAFWHWKDRPQEERFGHSPDPKAYEAQITHLAPSTIDVRLGYSTDGKVFHRGPDRGAFLATGPDGRFDSRGIWALPNPIVMGDEIWIYYAAGNRDHDGFVDPASGQLLSGIGRAVMRLDGFVSVDGGAAGGWIETPPLRFQGQQLMVNMAATGGGAVQIELLDEQGNAIPGYGREDAEPLIGDAVSVAARWRCGTGVGQLAGKVVRLRCHVQDGKLYSLRFQ